MNYFTRDDIEEWKSLIEKRKKTAIKEVCCSENSKFWGYVEEKQGISIFKTEFSKIFSTKDIQ